MTTDDMPDWMGDALTREEIAHIADTLKSLSPIGYSCPTCRGQKSLIANHLVSPVMLNRQGEQQVPGGSYPQVMVVCERCGFTSYHNAAVLGVGNDMRVARGE